MPLSCAQCGRTNLDLARACYACGGELDGAGPNSLLGKIVLGNYRLLELLGQGGMSVVYKAQHRVTEQAVAIKILPPDLAVYDDVKARFVEEARTLAKLEHPNIVHLYNFAEAEGRLHLVMQYADGTTFEQRIAAQSRLPWHEAVRVGVGVLDALEYAHTRGVVHRDIKPSNILVRADGSVKVMDFGIAKMLHSTRLTATGQTMGTVRYMSPEQVRGKELDGRSDLYSLGVTIYEALTGATPFDGESHFEIMQKHLVAPVPRLETYGVVAPRELEPILQQALAKAAEDRPPDARTFRDQLEGVLRAHPMAPTETAPWQPRRSRPLRLGRRSGTAAAAGVVVLAGSVAAWALLHRQAPAPPPPPAAAPVEMRWPELHQAARSLPFAVDQRYRDARLRVASVAPRNAESLRATYVRARDAYERFLERERVGYPPSRRPLNLVIVPAAFLRDRERFPDTNPEATTRYEPVDATLYLADLPGFEREDLPGGLALHFCPVVAAMSVARCQSLADGFEKTFRASTR